jgi:hypothetical protein
MDALSDVLRVAHLTGGVFLHADFFAPWCMAARVSPEHCAPALVPASGDSSYLGIYALFRTMRWSGWGTDPMTGQSADQTYFPGTQQSQLRSTVDLTASGGSYFVSGQDIEMQWRADQRDYRPHPQTDA